MAENRVIGRGGRVPWHLPADMRHFKRLTVGHPVVMGRKTFESLPGPLVDRRNIVLTRSPGYQPAGVVVVSDLAAALDAAGGASEVFVVGGEAIYRLALPRADRLYLTVVHTEIEGDTYFPPFDEAEWVLVDDSRHPADERHAFAFSIRRYERRRRR